MKNRLDPPVKVNILFLEKRTQHLDLNYILKALRGIKFVEYDFKTNIPRSSRKKFSIELSKANRLAFAKQSSSDARNSLIKILRSILPTGASQKLIAITRRDLPGSYFSTSNYENTALVSVSEWERLFSPPPLELYILREVVLYSLLFFRSSGKVPRFHDVLRGCIFDSCINKNEIKASLWGNICGDCSTYLKTCGVSHKDQDQALKVISNSIGYKFEHKESYMRVKPNPILRSKVSYEIKPKQIFVAIAWDLLDSVFVNLENSLSPLGYNITYAESKLGQMILTDIWQLMNEAEIVIADFTLQRPNVYLEYGMALALGKPIVVILQDKKDLPSDLGGIRYVMYKNNLGDQTFKMRLPKAIEDTLEDY